MGSMGISCATVLTLFFILTPIQLYHGVPRVWRPAEYCMDCHYPNDSGFQFCQQCGHRQHISTISSDERVPVDMAGITSRLSYLRKARKSKPYQRQKSQLQIEIETFLASLPQPKTLLAASPTDIVHFLIWKDKSGKTKVHNVSCPDFRFRKKTPSCSCPSRLAVTTVQNYISKLRSIFASSLPPTIGSISSITANPVYHPIVREYMNSIRDEQAQARISPKQAVPMFFDKLFTLCTSIKKLLLTPRTSPVSCYIYARDLAFFCLDFYSGDRASDLGRLKTQEVFNLPDNEGLLFHHTFGKTLRGKHRHIFAVKPSSQPLLCPVANLRLYVTLSAYMNIDLKQGFLFRVTDHQGRVINQPFLGTAIANRLRKYLTDFNIDGGETPHSFRAGCSITLSLLGASSDAIAKHIGWRSLSTADYYIQRGTFLNVAQTSDLLLDATSSHTAASTSPAAVIAETFRTKNDMRNFSLAFP